MPDQANPQSNSDDSVPSVDSLSPISTDAEIKAAKSKTKRPKPTLEGINAPVTIKEPVMAKPIPPPNLTIQEKRLISETDVPSKPEEEEPEPQEEEPVVEEEPQKPEPKLLPKSVVDRVNQQQKGGFGKVIGLIILLILGFGGYQVFQIWGLNNNKPAENIQIEPNGDLGGNPIVMPTENASSTASSTTPALTLPDTKLKINSTPTGWLNVRTDASLSATIITKVNPGEVYVYSEIKSGWYNITLKDGRTGWVFGEYITVQK